MAQQQSKRGKGNTRKSGAKAVKYARRNSAGIRTLNKLARVLRHNGPDEAILYARRFGSVLLLRRVRHRIPGVFLRATVRSPRFADFVGEKAV